MNQATYGPTRLMPLPRHAALPDSYWRRTALRLSDEVAMLRARVAEFEARQRNAKILTPGELKVLRLLACGLTRVQIAKRLGVQPRTIVEHQDHIYKKLGVNSQLQAALCALRMGVLTIDEAWAVVEQTQGLAE